MDADCIQPMRAFAVGRTRRCGVLTTGEHHESTSISRHLKVNRAMAIFQARTSLAELPIVETV